MGYDVHITRKELVHDVNGPEISLDEWRDYVKIDREFELREHTEFTEQDGSNNHFEHPGSAVWIQWSKHGKGVDEGLFFPQDGNVTVKNPDKEIVRKMVRIAAVLDATVQGDDGEMYNDKAEIIDEHGDLTPENPWWQFWK